MSPVTVKGAGFKSGLGLAGSSGKYGRLSPNSPSPSSSSSSSSSSPSSSKPAGPSHHKKGHRRNQSMVPGLLNSLRSKIMGKSAAAPKDGEKFSNDNKEPRVVRGAVSNSNTSSKTPEEIMQVLPY